MYNKNLTELVKERDDINKALEICESKIRNCLEIFDEAVSSDEEMGKTQKIFEEETKKQEKLLARKRALDRMLENEDCVKLISQLNSVKERQSLLTEEINSIYNKIDEDDCSDALTEKLEIKHKELKKVQLEISMLTKKISNAENCKGESVEK